MSDVPARLHGSVPIRVGRPQTALAVKARVALVLVVAMLIAVRMPDILLQGRFWAEEGQDFFVSAWRLPWHTALLKPLGGYLNITANLAGMLAWYLPPLAWAPYVTSCMALAFQLCPAILLVSARATWLDRPVILVAAVLLTIAVPCSEEVWLSSIGTQCFLTLCTGLLLGLAPQPSGFRLALLALGALSGPGSWALFPLFVARAAVDGSRARMSQAVVLGAGIIVQVFFFLSHDGGRPYGVHPQLFLDIAFIKYFLVPFTGPIFTATVATRIHTAALAGHLPAWPAMIVIACLAAYAAVLIREWRSAPFWLLLGALAVAGASFVGALGDPYNYLDVIYGGRYAFAPQALVGLSLLAFSATHLTIPGRICAGCVVWLLAVGVSGYFSPLFTQFAHGPSWRTELALHRRDPHHVIASWPPGWTVPLPN